MPVQTIYSGENSKTDEIAHNLDTTDHYRRRVDEQNRIIADLEKAQREFAEDMRNVLAGTVDALDVAAKYVRRWGKPA